MEAVELVSTGNELLSGRTVNRHAQLLGLKLAPIGLVLTRDTTVPDDLDQIVEAVRNALNRVSVVLISGGLGPTQDDVTRDAMARLLDRDVVMDEESLHRARKRFRAIGRIPSEAAERQAQIVGGAVALPNSVGIAPGERIALDDKVLFMLPGPPAEFSAILNEHIIPWLEEQMPGASRSLERLFMVSGMGESDILTRLGKAHFPLDNISLAFCAAPGRVELRISAVESDDQRLRQASEDLKALLGDHIFAEERLSMEEVVGRLLVEQKITLATAESCTGGLVGHRITTVDGSSRYYLGGVVAYADEVKIRELNVAKEDLDKHGAVSEPVARQMAEGVRARFGADVGVGITGIAGPTGGTEEKPVGTVCIGLADASGSWARKYRFAGTRAWIKDWSSQTTLDLLRRRLQGVLR